MKRFIYADNAATTKLDSDALNEMLPWLQDEYGNASQPYAFARKPAAPRAITGLSKACLDMMTAGQLLPARLSIMQYYTPASP